MVLCFVLDLPSFGPPLLRDIQQLSNLLILRKRRPFRTSKNVGNIGLCALGLDGMSNEYKLQVVYGGNVPFCLRDFHHAVLSLTTISHGHDGNASECTGQVSSLSQILQSDTGLSSWAEPCVDKKIIMISCCFNENSASFQKTILQAEEQCIMVEFIQIHQEGMMLEERGNGISRMQSMPFQMSISDFENCSYQCMEQCSSFLSKCVKQWLQEIISNNESSMEVVLEFKEPLLESNCKVICSFYPAIMQLEDVIKSCETCRCHGVATDSPLKKAEEEKPVCPVTHENLDINDLANNCVRIGNEEVLCMPSFRAPPRTPSCYSSSGPPIVLHVDRCIVLSELDEGLLFGLPHIGVPSSDIDMDFGTGDTDKLTTNDHVFAAMCQYLYEKDLGLLCTSNTDIDMGIETSFLCFYILLASPNGSFLAKRAASSEELLLSPQRTLEMNISDDTKFSVFKCLSKMEASGYNPLLYERGCHSKLSWLVKESLHFRPMAAKKAATSFRSARELHESDTRKNLFDARSGNNNSPAVIFQPIFSSEPASQDVSNRMGNNIGTSQMASPRTLVTNGKSPLVGGTQTFFSRGSPAMGSIQKPSLPVQNLSTYGQSQPLAEPQRQNFKTRFRRIKRGQAE